MNHGNFKISVLSELCKALLLQDVLIIFFATLVIFFSGGVKASPVEDAGELVKLQDLDWLSRRIVERQRERSILKRTLISGDFFRDGVVTPSSGETGFEMSLGLSRREAILVYSDNRGGYVQGGLGGDVVRLQTFSKGLASSFSKIKAVNFEIGSELLIRSDEPFEATDGSNSYFHTAKRVYRRLGVSARLFGRTIQDSNVSLTAGIYQTNNTLLQQVVTPRTGYYLGPYISLDGRIYLTSYAGVYVQGTRHFFNPRYSKTDRLNGYAMEESLFFELSIFRLSLGLEQEVWTMVDQETHGRTSEVGFRTGLSFGI